MNKKTVLGLPEGSYLNLANPSILKQFSEISDEISALIPNDVCYVSTITTFLVLLIELTIVSMSKGFIDLKSITSAETPSFSSFSEAFNTSNVM